MDNIKISTYRTTEWYFGFSPFMLNQDKPRNKIAVDLPHFSSLEPMGIHPHDAIDMYSQENLFENPKDIK